MKKDEKDERVINDSLIGLIFVLMLGLCILSAITGYTVYAIYKPGCAEGPLAVPKREAR